MVRHHFGQMQRRVTMRALSRSLTRNNNALLRTESTLTSYQEKQNPSKEKASEILLLPGDEFVLSPTNVSSTLYEMKGLHCLYNVEEIYNLDLAEKSFIIRQNTCGKNAQGQGQSVPLGKPVRTLQINEIKDGVIGAAGTGATTWESSIVMSLYFSMRPELLQGRVLELGSGVGVAGLLTNIMASLNLPLHLMNEMESLTLSDYNREVIHQCRDNIRNDKKLHPGKNTDGNYSSSGLVDMNVCNLNWYDFIDSEPSQNATFDTIIASDVIYRKNDVVYLAATLSKCLESKHEVGSNSDHCDMDHKENVHSHSVHIFGPNNRAALHDLIKELRDNWDMEVTTEFLTMERYRLHPSTLTNAEVGASSHAISTHLKSSSPLYSPFTNMKDNGVDHRAYASRKEAYFLHVTVSRKSNQLFTSEDEYDINDLD